MIKFFKKKNSDIIDGFSDIEHNEEVMLSKDELLKRYLTEHNLVRQEELSAAEMESEVTEQDLGSILVMNGFISSHTLVDAVLSITNKALTDEKVFVPYLPSDILRDTKTMVVAETVKSVYVATLSSESYVNELLTKFFPNQDIIFVDASPNNINEYLEELSELDGDNTTILEKVLSDAINKNASDIHIAPRKFSYSILLRHLGIRSLYHEGDMDEYLQLTAKIKDRSRMDLAERRVPQDGGFSIDYNGRTIDLRVATVPTNDGEAVIIRILDPEKANKKITEIGITEVDKWMKGASRLNGICLICGGTGSGKTTTLNATMRELDRFGKAIYTAEDPVEYNMAYINQVNINDAVGLDFSRALKSFMRADPDVIIIGEIRDPDTARNAIKAAETGHLVFATLHTSSILGAVNRLKHLGVQMHELKYILRSVLAQTLVRTICHHCNDSDPECNSCHGSGYSNRTIVSECHYFNSSHEVENTMEKNNITWKTIIEDAYSKYINGETDLEELERIFGHEIIEYHNTYIIEHGEDI